MNNDNNTPLKKSRNLKIDSFPKISKTYTLFKKSIKNKIMAKNYQKKVYMKDKFTYQNFKLIQKHLLKYKTSNRRYEKITINNLIASSKNHVFVEFRDKVLFEFQEEFLKRFYNIEETLMRLPKFFDFYLNYLNFFSQPTLNNFSFNEILQDNCEEKAELFYQNNLSKDNSNSGIKIINDDVNNNNNKKIESTIFTTLLKENIENTILMTVMNMNDFFSNNNVNIDLNDVKNEFNNFNENLFTNKNSLKKLVNYFNEHNNCNNKKNNNNIKKNKFTNFIKNLHIKNILSFKTNLIKHKKIKNKLQFNNSIKSKSIFSNSISSNNIKNYEIKINNNNIIIHNNNNKHHKSRNIISFKKSFKTFNYNNNNNNSNHSNLNKNYSIKSYAKEKTKSKDKKILTKTSNLKSYLNFDSFLKKNIINNSKRNFSKDKNLLSKNLSKEKNLLFKEQKKILNKNNSIKKKIKEKNIKNIKISKKIINNINISNYNIHNNFILSPKTKKYSRNSNGNSLSQINSYTLFRSLTNDCKLKNKPPKNFKSYNYYNNNNNMNKNNFFSLRRYNNKSNNIKIINS